MNILTLLFSFFIMAAFITIATNVFVKLLQIIVNAISMFLSFVLKRQLTPLKLQQFKLIFAFIMTTFLIIAFNLGILTVLEIPTEGSLAWFPVVDRWLTIIFLTGGARSIHKLQEAVAEYQKLIADSKKE